MKSNSYSPNKNRTHLNTDKRIINRGQDDYKDDPFFYEKPINRRVDLNQTQDHASAYSTVQKKSRHQKLEAKSGSPDKTFYKQKGNSRNSKQTQSSSKCGHKFNINKFNQKRQSKKPKVFEIKDIVSIVGISSQINANNSQ